MPRIVLVLLGILLALPARAEGPAVDVALVLAVDASGSIDDAEFALQRQGIAGAVTHRRVVEVITRGAIGRVAFAYVEWGGPGSAATMVDWIVVEDAAGAEAFAAAVLAAPRSYQSYNAIGDAITHATALLAACPCSPLRRVIDISGDNPDSRSLLPAPRARDAAMAAGITVNALAILNTPAPPGGRHWLVENYEGRVIGGPGAFVMPAEGRDDFTRALLDKLIIEMTGLPPADGAAEAAPRGLRTRG
ncbi:DUF1194 domain-containing protein [Zavarzinia compransoris]|uniref:DUF1194 domain-containing protein n=1 Tax=Zavarzinia compransoris TaxID=1264899 RepID=A0A317E4T7_9PROT|nr:DUF1194 domain-containing protein [Zavarzinia compransoris]PWR22077.1 hypothetical protein DKG75_08870 [Zavarzinia compransoris]TDP47180.1 uncharacterized protein DUF1194 [Zavarzinia compransoris]